MSYHVFFAFSQGLTKPIAAPKGALSNIFEHVATLESTLGIERETYNGVERWNTFDPEFRQGFPSVDDKVLCDTVMEHNRWVAWLYDRFADWAKQPIEGGDTITPEDAAKFWPGLTRINVDPSRWTIEYYRHKMEHLYEVMRGREDDGVTFNADEPLTEKQAAAVICLFSTYLDNHDLRLEVARGEDHLSSFYHGEYEWCERCGAVPNEDPADCRERGCPVQRDWCDEDRPEWYQDAEGDEA